MSFLSVTTIIKFESKERIFKKQRITSTQNHLELSTKVISLCFCLYFTILLLLLYTKTVQYRYIHYLQYNRAINTTYSTRQLLHPTYYKELIFNKF